MKDSILNNHESQDKGSTKRGRMNATSVLIDDTPDCKKGVRKAISKEKLFGLFLQRYLLRLGLTKDDLACECYMPDEFVDSLLEGEIPIELIDDELLDDISTTLDVPADVFRIILGRDIPDLVENSEKKGAISQALAKSFAEIEAYADQELPEVPDKEVNEQPRQVEKINLGEVCISLMSEREQKAIRLLVFNSLVNQSRHVNYERKSSTIERLINSLKSATLA